MADFLRFTALVQGMIVAFLTIIIVFKYIGNVAKTKGRARIVPIHVVLIGTSYIILTIMTSMIVYSRIGEPVRYTTIMALLAFTLGDLALFLMVFHLVLERRLLNGINNGK